MSVQRKPVVALIVAKLLSTAGSWMNTVALPWLVLTTTGSPARMSLVLAAQIAGIVLLGVPSGALVARLGVRRAMLLGDAARAPLVAAIPLLFLLDALLFPVLLALSFAVGAFTASYVASQRLVVPALVGEDPNLVARTNSLIDGANRVGNLVGPAVAGLLIGVIGATGVLWIDATTFLISFMIILLFVRTQRRPAPPKALAAGEAAGPRWVPLGMRYLAADTVLRWMAVSLLCVGIVYPLLMIVLPVLTRDRYGGDPRTFGALMAASGLGLAVGSLLAVWLSGVWPIGRLGAIAVLGAMGPLWLLVLPLHPVATGIVLAVSGTFIPTFSACLTSYFTLRTREPARAQVMTSVITTENLAGLTAYASGGMLLAAVGTQPVLTVIAIIGSACALSLLAAVAAVRDSADMVSASSAAPLPSRPTNTSEQLTVRDDLREGIHDIDVRAD